MSKTNDTYAYLLTCFEDDVIRDRYAYVDDKLEKFIVGQGLSKDVFVCDAYLEDAIIDYFADIQRIKDFHDIEKTNGTKRTAYMAYWILRNRPLQLKNNCERKNINESFVITLILNELVDGEKFYVNSMSTEIRDTFEKYIKEMAYFFRYRQYNAQTIELMITNFKVGLNLSNDI